MKYTIETYGCQMNKAESDALEIELMGTGWKEAEDPSAASVIIINTCSVRKTAEDRIWGRIGYYRRLKKQNPDARLIITGCMAERLKDRLIGGNSPVDAVFGTFEKNIIIEYINHHLINRPENDDEYKFRGMHTLNNSFKAFVPVMNGCNNFCSYCIVPYVRGREVSRPPAEILREIGELDENNVLEITLLGQNVNSYSFKDENGGITNFPELLSEISSKTIKAEWIRFLTSHPKDLSMKLIDTINSFSNICRHIHLPVQSGSDRILEKMNRKYTSAYYYDLVDKIRKKIPSMTLTTDIIVGFPGETDDDFKKTCKLMSDIGFSDAFTYYYNPREGTTACDFDDNIEKSLKLERLSVIIELQREISSALKKDKVGNIVRVLAEGMSKKSVNEIIGRTESDEMIVFSGNRDKIGKMHDVRIISLAGNTFKGELLVQ